MRQDNNYRTLKAFQKAECIYDVTYYFANTFLKVGDRTIDFIRTGEQQVGVGRLNFGKKEAMFGGVEFISYLCK